MESLHDFHLLRPWWLLALLPTLLLCGGLWWSQSLGQQWQKYIAPHLLPFLLDHQQIQQKRWPLLGLGLLWSLAIFALAGPVWKKIPVPVERNSNALVICWDLSPSMLAEDVKPSRLVKSRLKIIDLLKSKKDGQVGLVAYSGEAYLVTPLTDDFQTVINLLPALSPTTLPTVGSNPEMAFDQANQLLKDSGIRKGNIVFLTDEITSDAMLDLQPQLQQSPHQVTIWGIGTAEGAPIPLPNGGFAKDSADNIVVTKLNQDALQNFSVLTGSYYVPVVSGDSDIDTINTLTDPNNQQAQTTERHVEQWFEHGQYFVFLLLPFALLLFRRGLIFSFVLLPIMLSPDSQALTWTDLWYTQDQQAQAALDANEENAALKFSTPEKRGAELFKQGEFEAAAEQFAQQDSAQNDFNRGTALAHAGQYDDAINYYESALQKNPAFEQAKQNLEITKELQKLAQQQEQEEQEQQEGDGEQNKDQQQDGEQQNTDQQQKDQQQGSNSSQDQTSNQQNQNTDQSASDQENREQQDSNQAQQQSSAADHQDNPFATDKSDRSSSAASSASETLAQTQQSSSAGDQEPEQSQQMVQMQPTAQSEQEPMTEQQQMLEQWLRKVPDDPSGLMRNKFKHQYMQRRQQLGNQSTSNQAERRW